MDCSASRCPVLSSRDLTALELTKKLEVVLSHMM